LASTSKCEPYRAFIDAQLRLGRNAMAIYQDLVDLHGFEAAYNSVKRFAAQLRHKQPEQFDRLTFQPGEEMQVDYGEGAPTRVPGTERWRKPRLFVATLRYSRRSFRHAVKKLEMIRHLLGIARMAGCNQHNLPSLRALSLNKLQHLGVKRQMDDVNIDAAGDTGLQLRFSAPGQPDQWL